TRTHLLHGRRLRGRHGRNGFAARFGSFAAVPALLVRAGDERAVALRILREQIRLPALRTRPRDRSIPRRELAVRIVHAAEEALSEPALALRQPAAAIRADHTLQGDRPGGLARRIIAAGEEASEAPALVDHRLAASRA